MQSTVVQQPLPRIRAAGVAIDARAIDLRRQRRPGEEIIRFLLMACGVVSILTTIGIVLVLAGNTIGFFQSKAFVIAKVPVANAAPLATLSGEITESGDTLRITYIASGTQFNNQQYLQVDGEIMRVVERTQNTLIVQRGSHGTEAAAHPAGADIYPMRETQAKPVQPVQPEDGTINLPEGFGRLFRAGDVAAIGTEQLRVAAVEGDVLVVERGYDGTRAAAHDTDAAISLADYVTVGEFFTHTVWQPQTGEYGIWPLLMATLLTSGVALALAIPFGLGAAIYLSEYASASTRSTLKPILEILAGIPTVVYGFFALTFVTPTLKAMIFGGSLNSLNILSAGITVGILITPMISSMCEDAISAVPRSLREASYGLGATRLETTIKVVLPAAMSGISAAVIVAMSRAVGETMIVLLASGAGPNFTFDLRQSAETMAGHIARISTGDIEYGSLDFTSIFAVGTALFVVTFMLNVVSNQVSRRLREQY